MSVRVVTDSTCDLPVETVKKYDIKVIPLYINIGKQEYLDGVDITREEFSSACLIFLITPPQQRPHRSSSRRSTTASLMKARRTSFPSTSRRRSAP